MGTEIKNLDRQSNNAREIKSNIKRKQKHRKENIKKETVRKKQIERNR